MYRLLLIAVLLFPFQLYAQWFSLSRTLDDQPLNIKIWARDAAQAEHVLAQAEAEAVRFHAMISPLQANSEISQLNRSAAHHPVAISQELYDLLLLAEHWSVKTQGGFDLTQMGIGQLDENINYTHIITEPPHTVRFLSHRLQLDITPFAAGYLVDEITAQLKAHRVRCAWVQYGHVVRVTGSRHGSPWVIKVANNDNALSSEYSFPLINSTVAAVGAISLELVEGEHHIVHEEDEELTQTKDTDLLGVITLAYNGMDAVIYANSISALGKYGGLKLVNDTDDVEALLIDKYHTLHYSQGLR